MVQLKTNFMGKKLQLFIGNKRGHGGELTPFNRGCYVAI